MNGCPFLLFNANEDGIKVNRDYYFCKGHRACQLVMYDDICDGSYDCLDRQINDFNSFTHISDIVSFPDQMK